MSVISSIHVLIYFFIQFACLVVKSCIQKFSCLINDLLICLCHNRFLVCRYIARLISQIKIELLYTFRYFSLFDLSWLWILSRFVLNHLVSVFISRNSCLRNQLNRRWAVPTISKDRINAPIHVNDHELTPDFEVVTSLINCKLQVLRWLNRLEVAIHAHNKTVTGDTIRDRAFLTVFESTRRNQDK